MKPVKYFGAANGYGGFRSYFDKIFKSDKFNNVYVIKGGPGTGKSSLMKKISAYAKKSEMNCEEIYCSSDPYSLDGIIINYNGQKIAMLDGTSPHERDAVVPGAIDEIINLGVGWDSKFLLAQKDKILSLTIQKAKAYRSAYFYLSLAGRCMEEIRSCITDCIDLKALKNGVNNVAEELLSENEGKTDYALLSSYGRFGSYRLDSYETDPERTFAVRGERIICELFMTYLKEYAKLSCTNMTVSPSALDGRFDEGIYFPDRNISVVITDNEAAKELNTDEYAKKQSDTECIRKAKLIYSDALDEAKRYFCIASDMHSRLEEYYSSVMNFDVIDEITEKYSEIIVQKLRNSADT